MKYKAEIKVNHILLFILLFVVLLSNIFSETLSYVLLLKPKYSFCNQTEIHFVFVGQGDAIGIKFNNGKTMLIDTGVTDYQKNLTYYLDNILLKNSKRIDYLLLTHIDADHSGNMEYILNNYNVGRLYRPKIWSTIENSASTNSSAIYDGIIATAINKGVEMVFNEVGVSLQEGETILTWLSPLDADNLEESNDFSPVIRLDYNNHSALFTGDISEDIEEELIINYSPSLLDVDILKLAHHGSKYSNSYDFISATSPEYACVSVGKNTYGHPANKTLERILEYDESNNAHLFQNLYSTKDDGNVIFTLKNDISVDTIKNIFTYSFVSYYWFTLIASGFLIFYLIKPYYTAYRKNRRFVKQNREFEKVREIIIE